MPGPVSRTATWNDRRPSAAGVDLHLARLGELERVPDEVDEDLPDALAVEHHLGRRARVVPSEADPLLRGERAVLRDDGLDELPRVERLGVDGELPGLDLRQVQDLVDQPEQVLPAPLDPSERGLLLGVERTVHAREERIGEPEDGGHRRPQLVADVGQEPRLRLAGPLERRVGLAESRGQQPLLIEQRRQALARAVQIPRQRAELVAVRHLDALVEVAGRDVGQPALHLPDRQDERPREDEPEQQGDDDARRRRRRSPCR